MKKIFAVIGLALFATSANAADGKMSFELPKGWVLDKKVVANQGIDAAIYPKNQEWKTAPAVIYLRLAPKVKNSTPLTIEDDLKGFKEINEKLDIRNEPGLYTHDNKLAFVRRLTDPANGSTSITAYVDSNDSVSIIAIDAKSKAAAEKAYPIFKSVVNSYIYVVGATTHKVMAEGMTIEQTNVGQAPAKTKVQIKPSSKRAESMEYRDFHKPAPVVAATEKEEVKEEAKPELKPEPKKEPAPVAAEPKVEPKKAEPKKVEKPVAERVEIIEATEEEIKKDTSGEYEYEEVVE